MPFIFRLGTVFLVFFCFGFGVFKMAFGLLGQKIKKIPCVIYIAWFCAASWAQAFLGLLLEDPLEKLFFELIFLTLHAVVLGLLLKKFCHLPFIHTLTAAVLGNFIVYTVYNVVNTTAFAYSPVFDGKYLYVLTTIQIPGGAHFYRQFCPDVRLDGTGLFLSGFHAGRRIRGVLFLTDCGRVILGAVSCYVRGEPGQDQGAGGNHPPAAGAHGASGGAAAGDPRGPA